MKYMLFSLIPLVAVYSSPSAAISDAGAVGANAGAMIHCYNNFSDGETKSKYKLLKLSTYDEYKKLDSHDRTKALITKKAAEDGEYLGDPLDQERCNSLRKTLYLKYH
ncbi:hypothetical protein AAOGI_32620 [Agarivorans albus]|uniref:hypothetical protein n=1 Tax=Agarivorans sp. JK6 TaxID=2997426 RepID=UPI0037E6C8FF